MNKSFKEMTYKEFIDYCDERVCDGRWNMNQALSCIAIREEIDAIKVKVLGITSKKRTEQAKEEAWKKIINLS